MTGPRQDRQETTLDEADEVTTGTDEASSSRERTRTRSFGNRPDEAVRVATGTTNSAGQRWRVFQHLFNPATNVPI